MQDIKLEYKNLKNLMSTNFLTATNDLTIQPRITTLLFQFSGLHFQKIIIFIKSIYNLTK